MGYSRKHSRRHSRRHSKQRGGGGAADFVSGVVGGSVGTQISNVFGGNSSSNVIKPLGQSGGGRRRRRNTKQKGGYWSQVINNAFVPLTLFALNKYAHNKSKRTAFRKSFARTMKRMR